MAVWDKKKAIEHLNCHAQGSSLGHCARYTRLAIEAGGLTLTQTRSAKDYGPSLIAVGFLKFMADPGTYLEGDVVVIDGFAAAPDGHMAMFNGSIWVSDFKQRTLYPGPDYRTSKPPYFIYRYGLL